MVDGSLQESEYRYSGSHMELLADFPEKLEFLFEPCRYKIAYGGRGGAKSWGFARALLILGIQQPLRILCARETMESIQQSVHQVLRDQIGQLGLGQFYDVQKSSIIGSNGTLFTFAGLSHNVANIKSLESYDIVWVEEAQTVSKESWETLIPTIRKDGSEVWVSFNPKISTDDTYKRFVLTPRPDAKLVKIGWQDNPWFPEVLQVEMEHLRATDHSAYLHVYEGECASNVEGAIYAQELKKATDEGRIGLVPYSRRVPVDTVWDLGYGDLTAIWMVQSYDNYFSFIDYVEGSGLTIADYLIKLQNRAYLYGTDYIPYDGVDTIIHKKLAGDRTMSIEQLMRSAGRNVRIVPKVLISDRINSARTIFPQCRFDEVKCADGIQALRHYQWELSTDHGEIRLHPITKQPLTKREPLHNWASHAGEAFTRAGQALRQPVKDLEEKQRPVQPARKPGAYAPFG